MVVLRRRIIDIFVRLLIFSGKRNQVLHVLINFQARFFFFSKTGGTLEKFYLPFFRKESLETPCTFCPIYRFSFNAVASQLTSARFYRFSSLQARSMRQQPRIERRRRTTMTIHTHTHRHTYACTLETRNILFGTETARFTRRSVC